MGEISVLLADAAASHTLSLYDLTGWCDACLPTLTLTDLAHAQGPGSAASRVLEPVMYAPVYRYIYRYTRDFCLPQKNSISNTAVLVAVRVYPSIIVTAVCLPGTKIIPGCIISSTAVLTAVSYRYMRTSISVKSTAASVSCTCVRVSVSGYSQHYQYYIPRTRYSSSIIPLPECEVSEYQ